MQQPSQLIIRSPHDAILIHVKIHVPSHGRLDALRDFFRRRQVSDAGPYSVVHYSQEGEDVLLSRIFGPQEFGFYVDVGAHDPRKYSNTYLFYKRGWTGISIDPRPGFANLANKFRPRDVNLEVGVGLHGDTTDYFTFPATALNTTSESRLHEIPGRSNRRRIKIQKLSEILEVNLPAGTTAIDFMTVDTEGGELEILQSNDWRSFRPRVIVIEISGASIESLNLTPISRFLTMHGYESVALLYHSAFFVGDPQLLAEWKDEGV